MQSPEQFNKFFFTGKANAGVMIYYILEPSKENILQFSKGTAKCYDYI